MATRKTTKSASDLTKIAPLPHDQENKVPTRKPPTVDDVVEKTTKGVKPKETPKEEPKKPGTAVMSYKDRMAALVAQTKKAEAPQGGFLSTKGGRLSIGGVNLPGDMIRAIITARTTSSTTRRMTPRAKPPPCATLSASPGRS